MTQENSDLNESNHVSPLKKLRSFIVQLLGFIVIFFVISSILDFWRGKSLSTAAMPIDSYVDIADNIVDIAALSEQELTVVYFWATWCGPCKITSPSIKQLAKHYNVVTVAMASGEDAGLASYFDNDSSNQRASNKNAPHKSDRNKRTPLPIINDDSQDIAQQWGIKVTPTVLFIKNRKILGHTTGASGFPGLWARAAWLNR